MKRLTGWTLALALCGAPALADPIEDRCSAANEKLPGSCSLERPAEGDWSLTTRVVLGEAGKEEVKAVEEQFCKTAWSSQRSAQVTRWNALIGTTGKGARMDWRCGLPSVAAAPR